MYLTHMAALVVSAFRAGLTNPDNPILGVRDPIWVGPEFPAVEANYPGVWVTFDPGATLRKAGISHVEFAAPDAKGHRPQVTRWLFDGTVSATVVALTRRERDELLDEIIRVIAFADEHPGTSQLRDTMETNPYIAVRTAFDDFRLAGISDNGRTPWGSDEIVHEGTVTLNVQGEFVSDVRNPASLVLLERIEIHERIDTDPPDRYGDGWQ